MSFMFFISTSMCLVPIFVIVAATTINFLHNKNISSFTKGCRRLGKHLVEHVQKPMPRRTDILQSRVTSLWIFPVKSCRGVELDTADVVSTGMKYDRQFSFAQMEADTQKWRFLSQRHNPLLAHIKTELWIPDPSLRSYSASLPGVQSDGVVVMTYPRQVTGLAAVIDRLYAACTGNYLEKKVALPFNPTSEQIKSNGYTMEQMTIWKDHPTALNLSSPLSVELQELKILLNVQRQLALFRVANDHEREVFRDAPREGQVGYQPLVGFADAYPLHIMNVASVEDVRRRVADTIPDLGVLRFRPNIVIEGPPAFDEDAWKYIRIGEFEYYVACRTARCLLPNVHPITGIKHPVEPARMMKSYRRIDAGCPKDACLGMQMVPAAPACSIRVGDTIEVLRTGEHIYAPQ
ncbi:hypothetical protein MMC34_006647 [Xylographa carneopallida]|nr:hypothetical protein [Xylographa carneopallida]